MYGNTMRNPSQARNGYDFEVLRTHPHGPLGALFTLLILTACSSSPKTPHEEKSEPSTEPPPNAETSASPEAPARPNPLQEAVEFRPLAFSQDGFPKLTRVYTSTKVLERIEADFNGDGRIDFIQYFDTSGKVVEREAADLDGDGVIDVTYFYEADARKQPQLVRQEFNARYDGRTTVWKDYEKGQLVRRALDRRGSGRPDYWEYYDKGRLVRIDKDDDGDGNPDSQTRYKQVIKPSTPENAVE